MKKHIQTIQQTDKSYKGFMALGVILIIVGGALSVFASQPGAASLGLFAIIIGIPTYLGARILAWWNHG